MGLIVLRSSASSPVPAAAPPASDRISPAARRRPPASGRPSAPAPLSAPQDVPPDRRSPARSRSAAPPPAAPASGSPRHGGSGRVATLLDNAASSGTVRLFPAPASC